MFLERLQGLIKRNPSVAELEKDFKDAAETIELPLTGWQEKDKLGVKVDRGVIELRNTPSYKNKDACRALLVSPSQKIVLLKNRQGEILRGSPLLFYSPDGKAFESGPTVLYLAVEAGEVGGQRLPGGKWIYKFETPAR